VIGLSSDLDASVTGLLLVAIGLPLAYHGATVWRRATTWIGGGTAAFGLAVFLADMAGDDATIGGMLFIAGGIAMVFAGHAFAAAVREPDEMAVTAPVSAPVAMRSSLVAALDANPPVPPTASDPSADDTPWMPPPADRPPPPPSA
jgi:hypothetical protein